MYENIRLSLRGIFSHKLRSILTMLGIIIGIASIIAIVSTIKGTNDQIQTNLIGSGVNTVNVRVSQSDWEYDFDMGIPSGFKKVSKEQKESISKIKGAISSSYYNKRQTYDGINRGRISLSGANIYGIDENFLKTQGLVISNGKGFSKFDIDNESKIVLLDQSSAEQLFLGESPIGKTIELKAEPFVVVGVVKPEVEFEPKISTIEEYHTYNQETASNIYVPNSTWSLLYQYDEPENVIIRSVDTNSMTEIGKNAETILNKNIISKDSEIKYKAQDLLEQAKQMQQLSAATNTMLIWIAGISLLVGGIGVMNIMLVSVTERTREIGLKKSIGAPKKSILIQFLTEAVVLTSTGGVLGVIFGVLLAYMISNLNGTPVSISIEASIFAVIFSMAIGIIFGLLPSYKAANLNPIQALRRE